MKKILLLAIAIVALTGFNSCSKKDKVDNLPVTKETLKGMWDAKAYRIKDGDDWHNANTQISPFRELSIDFSNFTVKGDTCMIDKYDSSTRLFIYKLSGNGIEFSEVKTDAPQNGRLAVTELTPDEMILSGNYQFLGVRQYSGEYDVRLKKFHPQE